MLKVSDDTDQSSPFSVENVLSRVTVYRSLVGTRLYDVIMKVKNKKKQKCKNNTQQSEQPESYTVHKRDQSWRSIEGIEKVMWPGYLYRPSAVKCALADIGLDVDVPDEIFSEYLTTFRSKIYGQLTSSEQVTESVTNVGGESPTKAFPTESDMAITTATTTTILGDMDVEDNTFT